MWKFNRKIYLSEVWRKAEAQRPELETMTREKLDLTYISGI